MQDFTVRADLHLISSSRTPLLSKYIGNFGVLGGLSPKMHFASQGRWNFRNLFRGSRRGVRPKFSIASMGHLRIQGGFESTPHVRRLFCAIFESRRELKPLRVRNLSSSSHNANWKHNSTYVQYNS